MEMPLYRAKMIVFGLQDLMSAYFKKCLLVCSQSIYKAKFCQELPYQQNLDTRDHVVRGWAQLSNCHDKRHKEEWRSRLTCTRT